MDLTLNKCRCGEPSAYFFKQISKIAKCYSCKSPLQEEESQYYACDLKCGSCPYVDEIDKTVSPMIIESFNDHDECSSCGRRNMIGSVFECTKIDPSKKEPNGKTNKKANKNMDKIISAICETGHAGDHLIKNLSGKERYYVHIECENLGLKHESYDDDNGERVLKITKT